MDTLITAEIRWFWEGKSSQQVRSAFSAGPFEKELTFSEPRTDSYLIFERAPSVGLKLREGRLEIKALVKRDGVEEADGLPMGIWEKRTVLAEAHSKSSGYEEGWHEVSKTRMLRRFQMDSGQIREVHPDQIEGDNCQVEVSDLKVGNTAYWSWCLECYAKNGRPEEILPNFFEYFMEKGLLPPNSQDTEPQSYPSFLLKLTQK